MAEFDPIGILRAFRGAQRQQEQGRLRAEDRRRAEADRRRQEKERQEERGRKEFDFVSRGIQQGLSFDGLVNAGGTNIPSNKLGLLKEMGQMFKKKQREAEQAKALPGRAERGVRAQQPGATEAQKGVAEADLGQLADSPEALLRLRSRIDTIRQQGREGRAEKLRESRFELARQGKRPAFVAEAAAVLSDDPTAIDQIRRVAVNNFGEEFADIMVSQAQIKSKADIANGTAAPVKFFMDDGADRTKARLAIKNLAFKDPLTELYIRGSNTGSKTTKASANKSMIEAISILRSASKAVAKADLGGFGRVTIAELGAKIGPNSPPELIQFNVAAQWAVTSIAYALSGAQYAEEFLTRIEKFTPTSGELALKDGKIAPSLVARINQLERILEGNHLSLLDNSDRTAGKAAIRDFRRQIEAEYKSGRAGEGRWSAPGTSDPAGASILDDLNAKAGIGGQ